MNSVQKLFLKVVLGLIALVLLIGQAQAQDACPQMPSGYLCIPRAIAVQALEDSDARKALEAEKVQLLQAIEDMRKEVNQVRIQFATVSGENTILKQQQVADRALMTVLVQNTKKKRFGLINIF